MTDPGNKPEDPAPEDPTAPPLKDVATLHREAASLEAQAKTLKAQAEALKKEAANQEDGKPKRRLLPLALSAFILPGAGQFAQKRYFIGALYMSGILGSFFLLMAGLMRPLIHNWQYIFGSRFAEPEKTDWKQIGLGVLIFILIYAINLLDVWLAERRRTQNL